MWYVDIYIYYDDDDDDDDDDDIWSLGLGAKGLTMFKTVF